MTDVAQKARQRIQTACLGCREKKTKCDGNPAQCSACLYRYQECVYVFTENKRKPPSKNYVKALEARVASLEKQLALAKAPLLTTQAPALVTEQAMDLVSGFNPIDEVTSRLGRFQIADGGETSMMSKRSSRDIQMEGFEACNSQLGPLCLTEELKDHLLELFWRWQNQWQYFLSPKLFTLSIARSQGGEFGQFHSPLLTAAIYGLASRYSDRPELRRDLADPNTAGDDLLERIKVMLQYECEAPTTTTVQAVLLLSLCETARDKEALGFIYCGMATRMALNLGLHVDCSSCVAEGLLSAEEVEDRNVTWWGVYMLDKLFNIGLGRPSMIQERDVTAKMPSLQSEDELALWDAGGQEQTSHCVSIAEHTRHMFAGIAEVLDAIYSPHETLDSAARDASSARAHVRLVMFYNSLPAHLRLRKSPSSSTTRVLPHVYQLHMQYHVVSILLHRPFLKTVRLLDGNISGGLSDDDSHTEACRTSAEAIANILRWQDKSYGLRTAPISTIHCAFTAAVIFLVDASADARPMREKAIRNLVVCIEGLEKMEPAWAWSTRALVALKNIAQGWKIDLPIFRSSKFKEREPGAFQGEPDMFGWFTAAGVLGPFDAELAEARANCNMFPFE